MPVNDANFLMMSQQLLLTLHWLLLTIQPTFIAYEYNLSDLWISSLDFFGSQLKGRMGCTINSSYRVSNAILGNTEVYECERCVFRPISEAFKKSARSYVCSIISLTSDEAAFFHWREGNFLSWEMLLVLRMHSYHSFLEREWGMN